jgi:signal transduction histidine kinase
MRRWTLQREGNPPLDQPGEGALRPVIPGRAVDAVIALGVALLDVASALGAAAKHEYVPKPAIALLAAMGLILYPRRRFPGTVLVVMAALTAILFAMRTSLEASFIAVLIASYSSAVYGSRRLAVTLFGAAVAAFLMVGIPDALGHDAGVRALVPVPTLLAAAGAWLVGLVIRKQFSARSEHMAVLRERAELIAGQQEERARHATLAERLRIARELHDIVAHHLSVVVIQSQGAQRMVDRHPARAQAAMVDIERTGRTALDEMRRLLGLLRSGDAADDAAGDAAGRPGAVTDGAYVPLLGLADVEDLAERMRGAGLPVTVRTQGKPRDVPEDVGLTVYRIVQEALTNVLKHAGPAQATVQLNFADTLDVSVLDVTVTDDGRGAASAVAEPAAPGAGRGTTGMRERVLALGGKLTVGPRVGGGFRVHASIPLGQS